MTAIMEKRVRGRHTTAPDQPLDYLSTPHWRVRPRQIDSVCSRTAAPHYVDSGPASPRINRASFGLTSGVRDGHQFWGLNPCSFSLGRKKELPHVKVARDEGTDGSVQRWSFGKLRPKLIFTLRCTHSFHSQAFLLSCHSADQMQRGRTYESYSSW